MNRFLMRFLLASAATILAFVLASPAHGQQHWPIYALIFVNVGALFCGAAFTNKEPG